MCALTAPLVSPAMRTASQAGISSSQATTVTNITKLAAAATRKHRSILSMESPLHYSDEACTYACASATKVPNDTLGEN